MSKFQLPLFSRAALAAVGAAAMTFAAFLAAPASAATGAQGEMVWVVDASGRPPFQRSRVPASSLDSTLVASAAVASEARRRAGAPGKQRYQRRPANLEQVSFARFEEGAAGANATPRFIGAPGKNLRRRF